MDTITNESSKNESKGSFVRFSEDEYKKIKEDSKTLGKSIPTLLRTNYFKGKIESPTFIKEDAEKILTALSRIGNNLNQIAKKVNSGFREGFQDSLSKVIDDITTMKRFVGGGHGSC